MKILFTGGGTGGHLFPFIALANEIKLLAGKNETNLFYIGPADERVKLLLAKEQIKVKKIMAGKFRRYFGPIEIFQNVADILFRFPVGFFQAFFHVLFLSPNMIFSVGGYGSLPVTLAGFLLKTPVFLSELDISPGLANRMASRFASKIFLSFPKGEEMQYPADKTIFTGAPIRRELLWGSKDDAKKIFNLTGERPIILVLGGSQGARRINELIIQILQEILAEFELIHITGHQNFEEVKGKTDLKLAANAELKKYYHLFPFLEDDLKQAYAACDLIIGRAGSGTIFEIAALGKPSILIPLPESAQNHQAMNAYAYAASGAALVIEETNLTSPLFFLEKVKSFLNQPKTLEKMRLCAKNFSKPEAAKAMAEYIINTMWIGKF